MVIEFILGGAILLMVTWILFGKPSGLPPGRWGLPLLGYIPLDDKYLDYRLKALQKQYGDIYIWRFGSMLQVYVHDYNICKQMFSSQDFVNRPTLKSLQSESGEALGIAGSNGAIWHTNRRFSLRQLRDLGMGKSTLVSAVHEQADNLINTIKEKGGKAEPLAIAISASVVNIIWKMIADTQFESTDPIHKDLQKLLDQTNDSFTYASFADMFSWLQYVMPSSVFRRWFKLDLAKEAEEKFFKYFDELIDEHQKDLNSDAPRDLIDAYLIEMNEKKTEGGDGVRNRDDLKFLLFDMFVAGSDTTTGTLTWLCLYMSAFPEKQLKLQQEIDKVLPRGIMATMEDRSSMPYTEAVINEVLRKSSLANIAVPHEAVTDTMLAGYKIPKGTMIVSASDSIHHDERYWDNPDCFLPERWLNSDEKFVMKKEGFLPFGTGKRSCIGESLARMELFILTTSIFQNFNVTPVDGKQIDLLPDFNNMIVHDARKQDLVFNQRES